MLRPLLVFLLAASAAFAQDDPAEGKNDTPADLGPEATAEFVDPDKAEAVGGEGEEAKVGDTEPADETTADETAAEKERAGDVNADDPGEGAFRRRFGRRGREARRSRTRPSSPGR